MHPEIMSLMANEHIATLRAAARPRLRPARASAPRIDDADVELRLCKAADDPALERLAALAERQLPEGRLVLAVVRGQITAALPLAGGTVIADPFARTAHLTHLLEMRAAQLRGPELRGLSHRYVSLIRGSTHA